VNRRQLIKGIGSALCAGLVPPFVPALVPAMSFQAMLNEYLPVQRLFNADSVFENKGSMALTTMPDDVMVFSGGTWTRTTTTEIIRRGSG